ncbi:hypothetical protein GF373_17310 [bacterium]|nr:hypothetical protein [bacterium]
MKRETRRHFVKKTGGSAVAMMAASAPAVLSRPSPNDTIGVGCIGIGVRGGTLVTQIAGREQGGGIPGTKIVAVCDVYKPHREKGARRSNNPEVKEYIDYQELLADPQVDAITIATPDHWHAPILIDACNAGKDIYCEKGWTRTLEEAKAMRTAVKMNHTVMQLGHQARQCTAALQARELLKDGLLGPITFVRTGRYGNRPRGQNNWRWYGWYGHFERPNPKDVIRDLDWQRWLGNAPQRPFNMEHFWHWRCYWNYGTGVAGDLLSHELDFVQYILGYGVPDTCVSSGLNALLKDGREVPDTWNSVFTWERQGCTVTFDSCMNTRQLSQPPEFRGKDAMLRFDGIAHDATHFDVYAEWSSQKYKDIEDKEEPFMEFDPDKTPEQPSHMQDFFNCVRSRKKPKCHVDEAFVEAATAIMSVKALKEKREVRWNADMEEII